MAHHKKEVTYSTSQTITYLFEISVSNSL